MAQIAINVLMDELDAAADFCRGRNIGAEVTALAYPSVLDADDFAVILNDHREALAGVPSVSSHGPFIDLYATSRDPRVVAVCRARHDQALRASLELSATIYVAHLNSMPLIRNKGYLADFAERAAAFWTPLADVAAANGAVIVLENMWERSPDLQRQVVETAGHPGLRASFDNGHAQVFSDVPASEWIATLGEHLSHCHLHDNDGQYDAHQPVGEGIADWPSLLQALARVPAQPMIVLESDRLERNRASLEAWQEMTDGRHSLPAST